MPQSAQSRLEFLGIVQTGGGPQATEQENTKMFRIPESINNTGWSKVASDVNGV